jgi:GMP synthase-like glutamine amidotransferase
MLMDLAVLQHVPFEGPAAIADWAKVRGYSVTIYRSWEGELPELSSFDGLVLMGGPMSVADGAVKESWLEAEQAFVGSVIREKKRVFGVCLGAQIIASVLPGGRVYPGKEKEIGWYPVHWRREGAAATPYAECIERLGAKCEANPETVVFHWHGDTFDLPDGAIHLASSAVCANQAFCLEREVLGLQFHLEMTPEAVRSITEHCLAEIDPSGRWQQSSEAMRRATRYLEPNWRLLADLLDVWSAGL